MLPSQLLFCGIKANDLKTSQGSSIKSKSLDTEFASNNFFEIKRPVSNLLKAELNVSESPSKNKI